MLTMDDYGAIRRAHRDGKSIRQIAREFELARKTVRYVLTHAEPKPRPLTRCRTAPVLGPFQTIIDQILADDEDAPVKQRHTAMQIFRRLQEEHSYGGCYGQVQRYVHQHQPRRRETFIPLGHLPGQRLEADFGHIHVDFPEGRQLVPFLVTTWAYSNYPFVMAFPFERTEAILAGMVAAFEFFGRVPKEVWWDNPKTVASLIFQGRQRQLHPRYAALANHYAFSPLFCMPARGNEKPDAESTVKTVQRRFATPVPRVANLDQLNAQFRRRCEAEQQRTVQSNFGPFQIGARFAEEQAGAMALPVHRFDGCVICPARSVDKYQTAAFDSNRYSVPRRFAFQMVTVKGYVDQVVIVSGGELIATHARSSERGTMVLDPIHYLATLDRKPGALDHSPVYRDWKLPACFAKLRIELEQHHGPASGVRRYVRVLQLLGEHPLERVRQAIEECQRARVISAEAITQRTRTLAASNPQVGTPPPGAIESVMVSQVHVPLPDLSLFNHLMGGSSCHDDVPNEAFCTCADGATPERQSAQFFA